MQTNLLVSCCFLMDQVVMNQPVSCFPYQCFFMRDSFDFDDTLL